MNKRMPCIYVPHGGGPWPFVELDFGPPQMWESLRQYLQGLVASLPMAPRAIVCVSAHWEEPKATLQIAHKPPMLYDYYGFPPESYEIQWPASTDAATISRVKELLNAAGLAVGEDSSRGYDHGAFVPLKLMVPGADIPTIQLSLVRGLDPHVHMNLGKALSPLRDEGVLLLGSGMSSHNLGRLFDPAMESLSLGFDQWLQQAVALEGASRLAALADWKMAPYARHNHPREEHLLPLHVIAGAGADDQAKIPWSGNVIGVQVSAVQFG